MQKNLMPTLLKELQDAHCGFFKGLESEQDPYYQLSGSSSGLSMYEDDDKIYVKSDIPGCTAEDLEIRFEKGILWIEAEAKVNLESKKVHFHSANKFTYRVPVPNRYDENIAPDALCKDGTLLVTFTKSRAGKPLKIEVKSA